MPPSVADIFVDFSAESFEEKDKDLSSTQTTRASSHAVYCSVRAPRVVTLPKTVDTGRKQYPHESVCGSKGKNSF